MICLEDSVVSSDIIHNLHLFFGHCLTTILFFICNLLWFVIFNEHVLISMGHFHVQQWHGIQLSTSQMSLFWEIILHMLHGMGRWVS